MMFFIIDRKDKADIEENLTATEVESDVVKKYVLMISLDTSKEIMSYLLNTETKALFVAPLVSRKLLSLLVPDYNRKQLKPVPMNKDKTFEVLIAPNKKINPRLKDFSYYDLGDHIIEGEQVSYKQAYANNKLLNASNILLRIEKARPSLKNLFSEAYSNIVEEEINDQDISLKTIEIRNKEFAYLVVAEFIILSSQYYTKREIEHFMKTEFNIVKNDFLPFVE